MPIRFITDSCCDLPKEYVLERDFDVIPMSFNVGGQEFMDDYGQSLPYHDFYEMLRSEKTSTTAQITAGRFTEIFTPYLEDGQDIFYLAFSSALSGTYESAMLAAKELMEKFEGRKVCVVDSISASMGQGLLMHHILDRRDEGMDLEQIVKWTEENKARLCHWFTVFDLNHLKRGGRVSTASAFFGTMLSIKPVLHVDDEGRLIAMEKVKGRAKSINALFDHMKQTAQNPEEQTVFISHGDSEEDAKKLADMIQKQWGIKNIKIWYIGPVIGSHSGPDTIALFFLGSKR